MEQIKRVVSALIIIPPFLWCLLYVPPWLFLGLMLGITWQSLHEYFSLLQEPMRFPLVCVLVSGLAATVLVVTASFEDGRWLALALFFSVVALTLSAMMTTSPVSSPFLILVTSVFGVLFIGWGLSHIILLRYFPDGKWYILFLCVVVWVGDTSAMYAGRSLGRYKMAPTISPGKTWEGAVAGVLGSALAALVSAVWLLPQLSLWSTVLLGCGISLSAQLSDLGESLLKRHTGHKDSGALIPGHGGMLDRIDSMLFAAPTLVYMLNVILPVTSP
ncbi:MAG: phosphatidate cytidylyltransferase [Candidatus Tectimicrobiota bacterium]